MKATYVPKIVFGLIYLAFLSYFASSVGQLPERVATHFDLAGQPNGWMTWTQHVAFMAAMGLGLPLFFVGICFALRYLPNGLINFPGDREYWLAPERRAATLAYVFRNSFWPASMVIGLVAGLHYLTLQANRQGGALAHVSTPMVFALAGCFVIGMVVWIGCLYHHFRRR